ncbi:MAG: ATP-binding protein [Bacteroidia bacterium]
MKKIANKIVDYFIHPANKVNDSVYEKNRITVIAFIIVFFIVSLYTIYYMSNGQLFDFKASQNYLGVFTAILGLIINKKTGKTALALSTTSIIGFYLIGVSVYLSGGIYSRDILWYIVLIAASFMFIGIRMGIINSILSFCMLTFFFVFSRFEFLQNKVSPVLLSIEYLYLNFLLVFALLAFMLFAIVKSNVKLQKIVKERKGQEVREAIARDFHDQIGNKLASLRHLSALTKFAKSEAEKEEILNKIDKNAKEVYDNFKDFIWTKDPKSDQLQEVFMYLRDFADDILKFSSINLIVSTYPENISTIILPPNWSKEIIPMFKEIITNAYKHSEAQNIHVNFIVKNNILEIEVKDDGKGIAKNNIYRGGKGINNIMHRAKELNGKLVFKDAVPSGTEVVFTAQLPDSSKTIH